MDLLLLLFVLPFATIIFAIVLQKIINCPVLVALTFFSIYLILAFTVFDESFLVIAIIYTIIAYITAVLTRFVKKIIRRCFSNQNDTNDTNSCDQEEAESCDTDSNNSGCGCCRADMIVSNNYKNRRYWR